MRCSDVDSIIDDHRTRALSAAQRTEVDAHLEHCRRCSSAWLTNDVLAGEPVAAARAGLLDAMARRVRTEVAAEPARSVRPWPAVAGLAALLLVALFVVTTRKTGEPPALVEGRDYQTLAPAAHAPAGPRTDPIEVVQLFAYDCLPCYVLEQRMTNWIDRHGGEIALVRIPVQWNERAVRHARAYYAAEALGKTEEMQLAFYEEIQQAGNPLESDEALAAFFARFGVDRAAFASAFGSSAVETRASDARERVAEYGILGVPSFVVGGELVTAGALDSSPTRLVDVLDGLVKCVEKNPSRDC